MRNTGLTRSGLSARRIVELGCLVGLLLILGLQSTVTAQGPPSGTTRTTVTTTTATPGAPTATTEEKPADGSEKKPEDDEEGKSDEDKSDEPDKPIAVFVPEQPNGDKLISLSFDQADIDHVLKFLAEQSGRIIVKEPSVQTKVTIVSTAKITVTDAFKILQALLSVKGFSVIQDDDEILRIVPSKAALQSRSRVTSGDAEIDRTDDYITHIYQVEFIDAKNLKEDLKPLVPDEQGHLISNGDTNTLIIIDTARNVSRLLDIIAELDTDRAEVTNVEVIPLDFSDAEELAGNLNELFEREEGLSGLPSDVRQRIQRAMGGGGGGAAAAAALGGGNGLLDAKGQVKIVAETRTNSLIISASESNIAVIKDIVEQVDVDMRPDVSAKIVPLQFADPQTVSEQINQLYDESGSSSGGGSFFSRMYSSRYGRGGRGSTRGTPSDSGLTGNQIVPDVRTRSLIVTADEENMLQIMALIEELDIAAEIADVVRVVPLENAVATTVAETVNDLISGAQQGGGFFFALMNSGRNQGGDAPLDQLRDANLVADAPTNTILLTGPPETFETLERLIQQLDRRVPQVYIEVLIADVTLDDADKMGMEWSLIDRNILGHSSATGTVGTSFEGVVKGSPGLSYNLISNSIQAFLSTLETRSNVEILSSPNIVASDNTPATISIGEEIPYQESITETSGGSIQQDVGFVEVATTLEVTPHVNQRERISLEVVQTIDALIGFDEQLRAPRTAKRRAETTVEVRDGQTIIIGGIISKRKSVTIEGVPILRKLPWIGKFFESEKEEESRSELLVFLTPHIILDDAQVDALTEAGAGRLTVNPLEDPELKPTQLPRAAIEDRNGFFGSDTEDE
ncbi:MAG TPA: secretin N-terminal domain-containing protein, partial [Armatimonadota bacterium]|nr:secretin N-terminal domain-containing protein [Armatimonadota bacterium]